MTLWYVFVMLTTASDDLKTSHEDSYLGFVCVLRNAKDLDCSHDITESFVGRLLNFVAWRLCSIVNCPSVCELVT